MITCTKCSKENQDHYKFCLGCGAELPRTSNAPKPFTSDTPSKGVQAVDAEATGAGSPQPPAAPPPEPPQQPAPAPEGQQAPAGPSGEASGGDVTCPQCSHINPTSNRFCASCGYNLGALQGARPSKGPSAPPAAANRPSGPPAEAAGPVSSVVLTALRADGSEAGSYPLPDSPTITVGRDTGSIFAGDSYLSPRHATFARRSGLSIRDEGSLNGVYLKLKPNVPWPVSFGDIFRIGQEIVRFEELVGQGTSADGVQRLGSPASGYIGRLALVIGRDTTGNAFPVSEVGIHLGRERGDVLFSEDGYVSGLHCRVAREQDGKVYLTDVGSSNGTFIRLRSEQALSAGDVLLMGQQLFRVDM